MDTSFSFVSGSNKKFLDNPVEKCVISVLSFLSKQQGNLIGRLQGLGLFLSLWFLEQW
jgi:hypothetical protein